MNDTNRQPQPPPTYGVTYSPDGKLWWDGDTWRPAYISGMWFDGQQYVRTQSRARQYRVPLIVAALLFTAFTGIVISEQQREAELERQLDRSVCESFGPCR